MKDRAAALLQWRVSMEPSSFATAASEHRAAVFRLAFRLTGSRTDAEDVTQETFLLAYQAWSRFEGRADARTWLFRIAIREAGRLLKRRGGAPGSLDVEPASADSTARTAEARDERERLEVAFAALEPAHRLVLVLTFVEGLTAREVADVMRCPEGTVWSRLHYARRALAEVLERTGGGVK